MTPEEQYQQLLEYVTVCIGLMYDRGVLLPTQEAARKKHGAAVMALWGYSKSTLKTQALSVESLAGITWVVYKTKAEAVAEKLSQTRANLILDVVDGKIQPPSL